MVLGVPYGTHCGTLSKKFIMDNLSWETLIITFFFFFLRMQLFLDNLYLELLITVIHSKLLLLIKPLKFYKA